jgi:hypothetical protein
LVSLSLPQPQPFQNLVALYSPNGPGHGATSRAEQIQEVLVLARTLKAKLEAQNAEVKGRGRRLTDAGATWQLHQAIAERYLSALFRIDATTRWFHWDWRPETIRPSPYPWVSEKQSTNGSSMNDHHLEGGGRFVHW